MFSKFFKKKSQLHFKDPENSCFKEWINQNHLIPSEASREAEQKIVFDFTIFCIANFDDWSANQFEGSLNKQQKKLREEIAQFELGCWVLTFIDNWFTKRNHKYKNDIMRSFVVGFSKIPLVEFQLNINQVESLIVQRIIYYKKLTDFNDVTATISALTSTGFKIETPSTSVPPKDYNMLDFNNVIIAQKVMIWTTHYLEPLNKLITDSFTSAYFER